MIKDTIANYWVLEDLSEVDNIYCDLPKAVYGIRVGYDDYSRIYENIIFPQTASENQTRLEYWQRGYEQEFGKVIIGEYEYSKRNDICAPRMLRILNMIIRIS